MGTLITQMLNKTLSGLPLRRCGLQENAHQIQHATVNRKQSTADTDTQTESLTLKHEDNY